MLVSTNGHGLSFRAKPCASVRHLPIPFVSYRNLRELQQLAKPGLQLVRLSAAEVDSAGQPTAATVPVGTPQPADNILYVTRLGNAWTKDGLLTTLDGLFKTYDGFQSVDVVQSAETGTFTGYATFATAAAAAAARKDLRYAKINDKAVAVGTHKRIGRDPPSAKSSSSSGGGSSGGGGEDSSSKKRNQQQQQQQGQRRLSTQRAQARTIYVRNLAWATSSEDLQEHFRGCEGYEDAFITNNKEGRPSGYGFVRFAHEAAAAAAIKTMDQTELGGRTLQVELARAGKYEVRNSSTAEGQKQPAAAALEGASATETRVVVRQLPGAFTYREVFGMCSVFGKVRKSKLYPTKTAAAAGEIEQSEQDGVLTGGDSAASDESEEQQQEKLTAAVVFMVDRAAAERVVAELDGREVQGSTLRVNLYKDRKRRQADA